MKYLRGIFIHIQRRLELHRVKIINQSLYIDFDSRKRKHHMGQEETHKKRDKKIEITTDKRRDRERHCKHCNLDGHMEESYWKIHP